MTRAFPKPCLIATMPMLLAFAGPAVALEECVPREDAEFVETVGDDGGDGRPVHAYEPSETQEECAETLPGQGGAGGAQHVVAHFAPTAGSRQLLAIDTSSLRDRIGATEWLAQAVATAPGAAPQVIEIGLQQGAAGILLATRDAADRITVAGTPLRVIGGDRALVSIGLTGNAAEAALALGGPGGVAVRWPIAHGATVTLLAATGHGPEAAVIALGDLE